MIHVVLNLGPKRQYDVVCRCTVAEINEAITCIACPRAVDPRAEREAKPPADESGARRGRQVGGRRPCEGVCAVDGAQRRRRRGRLAFNARHPVEAEEDSQPDTPSSTSRLRPSSPTPTCSSRPVSLRARMQCSKQPHQQCDEASHRKEDHREQASESTLLALESGGLPSSGCSVGMRV